jgi:serine protease Do
MNRCKLLTLWLAGLALAFLLVATTPVRAAPDVGVEGRLDKMSELDDTIRPSCYYFTYLVYMEVGWTSIFELTSDEFNGYLILMDFDGNILAEDDDSGGGTNARIAYSPAEDGWYELRVTTSEPLTLGKYVLVESGMVSN